MLEWKVGRAINRLIIFYNNLLKSGKRCNVKSKSAKFATIHFISCFTKGMWKSFRVSLLKAMNVLLNLFNSNNYLENTEERDKKHQEDDKKKSFEEKEKSYNLHDEEEPENAKRCTNFQKNLSKIHQKFHDSQSYEKLEAILIDKNQNLRLCDTLDNRSQIDKENTTDIAISKIATQKQLTNNLLQKNLQDGKIMHSNQYKTATLVKVASKALVYCSFILLIFVNVQKCLANNNSGFYDPFEDDRIQKEKFNQQIFALMMQMGEKQVARRKEEREEKRYQEERAEERKWRQEERAEERKWRQEERDYQRAKERKIEEEKRFEKDSEELLVLLYVTKLENDALFVKENNILYNPKAKTKMLTLWYINFGLLGLPTELKNIIRSKNIEALKHKDGTPNMCNLMEKTGLTFNQLVLLARTWRYGIYLQMYWMNGGKTLEYKFEDVQIHWPDILIKETVYDKWDYNSYGDIEKYYQWEHTYGELMKVMELMAKNLHLYWLSTSWIIKNIFDQGILPDPEGMDQLQKESKRIDNIFIGRRNNLVKELFRKYKSSNNPLIKQELETIERVFNERIEKESKRNKYGETD
ncbi:hypothetical protein [Candidatus Fokinia crypta]|uniref:hypothetical protein n=1 Tax=Candidatus Fokinia crypta TaxID=1920990 RepID=UPI002B26017E|nr:hypothetical protein [Candidatus Fokinia cryptica]